MVHPKLYEGMCLCQVLFISKYFYIHIIITYLQEIASYLLSIQQEVKVIWYLDKLH